jgi:OFA family oxalate/formate antiporter-like MFS transporter
MKLLYKLSKSVAPCLLLTLAIGFCYAFSLFTPHIAEAIGCSLKAVQFTFCLNIFFLGMGAAMFGPLVERWIKRAAFLSSLLLILGLVVGGIACFIGNIWIMWIGCGVMCGLAEGIGYLTPNKNMMLWFPASNHKGLLTAISIFTFGLGSSICAWLFGMLFPVFGIGGTFLALAGIYAIPLILSTLLIQKPRYALVKLSKQVKSTFSYIETLKDSFFQKMWMFMFLNISMGLILIGSCASILKELNVASQVIIWTMILHGIFNGLGRLVFPAISDSFKDRRNILSLIIWLEILMTATCVIFYPLTQFMVVALVATYGAGFAVLPSILEGHFGKDTLSQRHGFCLTSWGMASLMAYLCTTFILSVFSGFYPVMILILVGFLVNGFVVRSLIKEKGNEFINIG